MRQHILLGRLVQWWSLTGLLPKYPGDIRDRGLKFVSLQITVINLMQPCSKVFIYLKGTYYAILKVPNFVLEVYIYPSSKHLS